MGQLKHCQHGGLVLPSDQIDDLHNRSRAELFAHCYQGIRILREQGGNLVSVQRRSGTQRSFDTRARRTAQRDRTDDLVSAALWVEFGWTHPRRSAVWALRPLPSPYGKNRATAYPRGAPPWVDPTTTILPLACNAISSIQSPERND